MFLQITGVLIKHDSVKMDYSEVKELIDRIVKAIQNGKYKVSYEEPNNIRVCTAPDGRVFYKFVDMDDAKSSNDYGSCYVYVEEHGFTCDLGTGEYESGFFDEIDEEYELEDGSSVSKDELIERVIDAFNDRDDIYFGEYSDMDSQMKIYAKINGIKDPEYYWCEDDYCPVDIDDDWIDYTEPSDLDYGTVQFGDREYYLVEEPNNEEGEQLHAVDCDEKPDDEGHFKTVLLSIHYDKDGKIEVTACEESEDWYSAVDGWVE